ncbi:MAG: VWA domain-containing protein [Lachnospiraceae bacterium]|nr:VWA domain-containing protein [Lachnospiraceae bacterium]
MELKNQFVIYIGIVCVILLIILFFIIQRKKDSYSGGKKVSNTMYAKDDPYFKKKLLKYRMFSTALMISCALAIIMSFILLTRPYKTELKENEKYSRDIILCIDISSSVDELNKSLVTELQDTVRSLHGERFGIVIFNTTPVMLTPLTDDYDYVIEVLEQVEKALEARISDEVNDDWLYLDQYISSGTLVGAEERGSSLIGDGLASSVYNFSDLDEERTRIIVFSTDNDLQGTPIVTLQEAADICRDNNVVVFGIGTKEMADEDMQDMEKAMIKTGGKFYLEEDSGTVSQIVSEIEKEGKSLVKGSKEMRTVDIIEIPFIILLAAVIMMTLFTKITKK